MIMMAAFPAAYSGSSCPSFGASAVGRRGEEPTSQGAEDCPPGSHWKSEVGKGSTFTFSLPMT